MNTPGAVGLTDFKFTCPSCGQHLACESGQRGTHILCPSCQQGIAVPATIGLAVHSSAAWIDPAVIPPQILEPVPIPVRITSGAKKGRI